MAGEGEKGRLRVSQHGGEPDVSPAGSPSSDSSPESAITQAIPVVPAKPAVADAPTVRAVARRVPSALPALGRDDGEPTLPRSARKTVARRQRSASRAARSTAAPAEPSKPADSAPAGPPPKATKPRVPEPALPESMSAVPESALPESMSAVPESAAQMAGSEQPEVLDSVPEIVDSAPEVPEFPQAEVLDAAPEVSATSLSGSALQTSESCDPEHAPEAPESPQPAALAGATLGGVLMGQVQTDEWAQVGNEVLSIDLRITGEPLIDVGREAVDAIEATVHERWADPEGDELDDAGHTSEGAGLADADLARPGPHVLDADSWGAEPAEPRNEAYMGRRRAKAPALRLWLVIGVVLVGLGAAIGIPLALRSSPGPSDPDALPVMVDGVTGPASPTTENGVTSPASPSASPATTQPGASPQPGGIVPSTASASTTTATAPFAPLTLQAENARLGGSAEVDPNPCSLGGPTVVRNVGDSGPGRPGTVTFRAVKTSTPGTYAMTVHYIVGGGGPRTLVVTVDGSATAHSFLNTSCTLATRELSLTLDAGAHTIGLGNPDEPAPMIDKIVITRA